jgi:hypothetical protein
MSIAEERGHLHALCWLVRVVSCAARLIAACCSGAEYESNGLISTRSPSDAKNADDDTACDMAFSL